MKKSTARLLASVLALVLSVSSLDMSVFAQKEAVAEAVTEDLITVSGNETLLGVEEDQDLEEVIETEEQETLVSEELTDDSEEVTEDETTEEKMTLEDLFNADLTEEEFFEELAKIEIDCEEDPEAYEMWKILMTDPASFYGISLMSFNEARNTVGNDYVEIGANNGCFTIGTTGGNPVLSSDDYQKMIYGHPGSTTSYTTICVGGKAYKYEAVDGFFDGEKNSYISSNTFDGITVQQEIKIVKNKSTGRDDVVQIKYTARNYSAGTAVDVGVRIMLDTMLGSNDAAPFKIPGVGSVTTEKEYVGSEIPKYWQAFDSLTNPGVVSQGRFVMEGYASPDKVQFTNWGRVYNTMWNYKISSGSSNGDSAVSAIWNEKSLAFGQSREYVTWYGLSEFEGDLLPPLALGVATDSLMKYDGSVLPEQDVTAYVQNISGATATNVKATIELPVGLKLVSGSKTQTIGTMYNNSDKQLDWVIALDTKTPKTSYAIKVRVTADGCEDKVVTKNIDVESEGKKAILIIPGIAGTRLYADATLKSENYLTGDYTKTTYSAGHMFWEPQTSTEHNDFANLFIYKKAIRTEARMMLCNNDGSSKAAIRPEAIGNSAASFGAQGTYTSLVTGLKNKYQGEYDVKFWGYDWRMDVATTADKLENYITEQGYTDVVLVCHSMGGLVATKYLSKSNANRQKVDKLITLGTPYLGAPKALYVLETGALLDGGSTLVMNAPIKEVANNFSSVYELLPTYNYFALNGPTKYVTKSQTYYQGGKAKANVSQLDYNETTDLINSRDWAQGKSFVSNAQSFASSLFTQGSHATALVDSYYIIGYGKNTIMQVKERYDRLGNFFTSEDMTLLKGGDGTVPMISANIGGLANSDKIYYVGDSHTGMVANSGVISTVKNIIDGSPNTCGSGVSKTFPSNIKSDDLKIKIQCPVDLVMVDDNNEEWAYVSPEFIYNNNPDEGSFYVMGQDNDTKLAFLNDKNYNVKLVGTGTGVMTYTLSLMESDFYESNELLRIVYENVPLTDTTIITTNTDYEGDNVMNVDEDGDGVVDYQIRPTRVMDAEEIERYENGEEDLFDRNDYSAITSDKNDSIQINGTNVVFNKSVLADGTCTFYTGKDVEFKGEKNSIAKAYQNGTKLTTVHEASYADVKAAIEEAFANVENALPAGVNSYGTTDAFYNITAPITNIVTDNSIVLCAQNLASVGDCVVYSRQGSVSAYISDMDFDGVIYAPNGTVTIYGSNIRIHGTIIADRIVINGQNVIFD